MSHDQLRALVWGQAYAAMLAKVLDDREWDQESRARNAEGCADETLEAFDRRWPAQEVVTRPTVHHPLETQRFGPGIP